MSNIFDRIHISPPELVKSDAQLGAFTLDATFVPLKNPDGTYCFLNTSYSEKPNFHRFVGTPEDFLLKDIFYEMDYNGYSCAEPSGIWIMSAYKYPDGMLVGFCHRELISRTDPGFGNCFFIGLAVSHDGGASWKYIGDMCPTTAVPAGNISAISPPMPSTAARSWPIWAAFRCW